MKTGKWIWTEPLPGTTLCPHHRRWACKQAYIEALRSMSGDPEISRAHYFLGKAAAYNAVMYDCHDPLAHRLYQRIQKAKDRVHEIEMREHKRISDAYLDLWGKAKELELQRVRMT